MNWKETVLKQKNIKWKPHLKTKDDDSLDFTLTIPLTALFEAQARWSFLCGVKEVLGWHAGIQDADRVITEEEMAAKFTEWGLADIWAKLTAKGEAATEVKDES